MTVTCLYCGKPAVLEDSAVVYKWKSYGMIWRCAPCDAYVGTHKGSAVRAPLGRLANGELRAWKIKAHEALDPLWMGGRMTRRRAYERAAKLTESRVRLIRTEILRGVSPASLARRFGITKENVHLVVTRRTWRHVR